MANRFSFLFMQLLILGAGYATRLYPLTLNKPKPLLPVAGKPMVDHVLEKILADGGIEKVYLVTNEKFSKQFEDWGAERAKTLNMPFKIVNDHSTDDSNKLGAIGDIHLVIQQEKIDSDLIVVAGDNLFGQNLEGYTAFCRSKNSTVLGTYDVKDLEEMKKYSSISVDAEGKITAFEEKPKNPTTTVMGIALYYYPKHILPMIHQYITEGNNPDQPGRLIQWLYPRVPVHTWQVPGLWYDIGSKETLEEADAVFSKMKS